MIASWKLSALALACMLAVACASTPPAPADYNDYGDGTGDNSGVIDYGDYDYSTLPSSPRPNSSPAPAVDCKDDDFTYYALPLNSAPVAEFKGGPGWM